MKSDVSPAPGGPPEGGASAATRESAASGRPGLIVALLCAAQFLVALDFSIVNVALPSMQEGLGFSTEGLQWVISAYALAFGGLLLLGGRAADLYGRRRLFVAGLIVFAAASLIGGLSASPGMLVAARALQGVGAAIVAPAALSLLTTSFREEKERNAALAAYGLMTSAGFVSGVILGGLLTEFLGWRWVMFVNVPIAVVVAALAPVLLPESRDRRGAGRRLDVPGAALVTAALVALVYALSEAHAAGWLSVQTLGLLAAAVVLAVGFVAVEARVANPMVPLSIFRRRTLVVANLVNVLVIGSFVGVVFVLTLFLQQVHGYSPLRTGLAFGAGGAGGLIAGFVAARIARRMGIGATMAAGVVLQVASTALLVTLPAGGALPVILMGLFVLGFGDVVALVMATIAATAGVADEDQGLAGGLITTTQQIGSGLGLAVIAGVAAARTEGLSPVGTEPTAEALVAGFRWGLVAAAVLAALALAFVFAMRTPRDGSGKQAAVPPEEGTT